MGTRQQLMPVLGLTIGIVIMTNGVLFDMALGQQEEVINGGQYLFQKFCSSCHGPQAMGNGPKAKNLRPKPANLTTLKKRNDGTFPFWRTYRMIDGREHIESHGTREMPVFGEWFQIPDDEVSIETQWADQVRGRIWQLLSYLKSIQVP